MDLPFSLNEPKYLLLLVALVVVIMLGRMSAVARPRDRVRIHLSTALRSLILFLIVLALSGFQLMSQGGPLNVVFLIDESGSVSAADREAATDFVRTAAAKMGPDDRLGVVRFGEQAILDRALGAAPSWEPREHQPSALATNIEEAVQLGSALFPEGGARRLVLLTDGQETVGEANAISRSLRDQGIQISVVPLGAEAANEVAVDQVLSPRSVPAGQKFDVRVLVKSTSEREATVSLLDEKKQVEERTVRLRSGDNVVEFNLDAATEGFHVLEARVNSVDDRTQENNVASSFTIVRPPPSVLVLAGTPEDAAPLTEALLANRINTTVREPRELPSLIGNLVEYDTVMLANVSAESIGTEGQIALQSYVRDSGHGLIMLGGDVSFGAGGYMRSPVEEVLPVSMDVRSSAERASIAMTFVVDKSGSMGRCHCGGNQQFDPAMRTEFGVNKLDIIKQAIVQASAIMNSSDKIGVVGFDVTPTWLVNIQELGSLGENGLQQSLQPVVAQGETNVHPGLQTAMNGLQSVDAELKHLVLLSDGWTKQADFTGLLSDIRASGMTLTTVAAGEGASDLLKDLATKGGGEYYEIKDIREVPDILLKETVRLVGAFYVEERLTPVVAEQSPILAGLDQSGFPPLLGYNSTTLKPNAEAILKSPRGDPLLAQWQYGLGRSVVWTSDAKGRWATEWITWPGFAQFVGQMVSWALPQESAPGVIANVELKQGTRPSSQDAHLRIESADGEGLPRNFLTTTVAITSTAGGMRQIAALQTSPGVYDAVAADLEEGVYAATVDQADPETGRGVAQLKTGIVVPYASEYRLSLEATN
ncbi:MAG: VWA domain-containing protein, partial [Chloroflexia bacterium]